MEENLCEKIVRRVPLGTPNRESDLVGVIDLIQAELGIGAGSVSMRDELVIISHEIERLSETKPEMLVTLSKIIEKLDRIQSLLIESGL